MNWVVQWGDGALPLLPNECSGGRGRVAPVFTSALEEGVGWGDRGCCQLSEAAWLRGGD